MIYLRLAKWRTIEKRQLFSGTEVMRTDTVTRNKPASSRAGFTRRLCRNEDGTTAIEFAMVALPFFMLSFGIMAMGLHFFTANALEHGVEAASRQVRTGQAQQNGITAGQFKQDICDSAGAIVDCGKLEVFVQTAAEWSTVNPQDCVDASGTKTTPSGSAGDLLEDSSGGAGQVVLVTACYEWELAKFFPYLHLSNLANGSSMIQAATSFRTEPYQ